MLTGKALPGEPLERESSASVLVAVVRLSNAHDDAGEGHDAKPAKPVRKVVKEVGMGGTRMQEIDDIPILTACVCKCEGKKKRN